MIAAGGDGTVSTAARALVADPAARPRRLIVACHDLVAAPPYRDELRRKRLVNDAKVIDWLATLGPHRFCCGHVHAAWTFRPEILPMQLCLNPGAPLMTDPAGLRLPGFLEIDLDGDAVRVVHLACDGRDWTTVPMLDAPRAFGPRPRTAARPEPA